MYLFQYVCRIDPEGDLFKDPKFESVAGAYVSVWVDFSHLEGAGELALYYARRAGWSVDDTVGVWAMRRKKCKRRNKRRFDEARKFGYTTVANMWGKDAPDADVPYD